MVLSLPAAELISLSTRSFFWGMYTVLVAVTIVLFFRQQPQPVIKPLLAMTALMYALSTSHAILGMVKDARAFLVEDAGGGHPSNLDDLKSGWIVAQEFIQVFNVWLADVILIWRVWIVWGKKCWSIILPAGLLSGYIVTGIFYAHSYQTTPTQAENSHVFEVPSIVVFAAPSVILTVVTNAMCTSLIIGRIWVVQRDGKRFFPGGPNRNRRPLLIILESGLIYSALWIVLVVFIVLESNIEVIICDVMAQMSGIIPTTIIFLILLDRTFESDPNFQHSIRFQTSTVDVVVPGPPTNLNGTGSSPLENLDGTTTVDITAPHLANGHDGDPTRNKYNIEFLGYPGRRPFKMENNEVGTAAAPAAPADDLGSKV